MRTVRDFMLSNSNNKTVHISEQHNDWQIVYDIAHLEEEKNQAKKRKP